MQAVRMPEGWLEQTVTDTQNTLTLAGVDVRILLAKIYRGTCLSEVSRVIDSTADEDNHR